MTSDMDLPENATNSFDVVIIGAGLAGINTAYRLQTELPNMNYVILEARDGIGGTWDLFRYPGVRSDSDLQTLGFSWRLWLSEKSISDGESIRNYICESAEEEGIDKKIRYRHRLLRANWSSKSHRWTLIVETNGHEVEYSAHFIQMCSGYYDYEKPLSTHIPGIHNFKGQVIHPQFWPENLDYTNKKVVIIGSGATAVTLFPALAKKAAHVTILQRSPTYIVDLPAIDRSSSFLRRFLPASLTAQIIRLKYLVLSFCIFQLCRALPSLARYVLRANCKSQLPSTVSPDPHFNPRYNPWEQRLCISPDGDFYDALHRDNTEIVTDTIENITEYKIQTTHGEVLEPDIIVTATGLQIKMGGGVTFCVDGNVVDISSKYFWRGAMVQNVPNLAFLLGYTHSSWTLGADSSALLICRLLKYMNYHNIASVVPIVTKEEELNMKTYPTLNLNSTYVERVRNLIPKTGDRDPWQYKRNFFLDSWTAKWSKLEKGLKFVQKSKYN